MIEHYREQSTDPSRPLLVDLFGHTSDEIWPKLRGLILERFPHLDRL